MNSLTSHAITALASLTVGAASAWYFKPPVVETRTEYRDKIVEVVKTVKERVKVQTKTRKETKPDGTRVEETTVTKTDTDVKTAGSKTSDVEAVTVQKFKQHDWSVRGMAGWDFSRGVVVYGAGVDRRVVGPVSIGAWGLSSGVVGVSVGVTF